MVWLLGKLPPMNGSGITKSPGLKPGAGTRGCCASLASPCLDAGLGFALEDEGLDVCLFAFALPRFLATLAVI